MKSLRLSLLLLAIAIPGFAEPSPTLLIISPPSLKAAWEDYADMRSDDSRVATVVDTGEIEAEFEGPDLQEKIRRCIRQHIDEHGVRWVILGGDSTPEGGLVPDRDTYHQNMWGKDTDIPTDLFYLSSGDWDHDEDGIYGEWEEDREAIQYPDGSVAIGRIPVRTEADVKAYARKVRHYLDSDDAIGSLTFTCAVPAAYPKVSRSGKEWIAPKWPEGEVQFLFNDLSSWDGDTPGDYDLSPAHLLEQMNKGKVTKWHLHGHGFHDRWVLENDASFTTKQVKDLENLDRLPVITTVSCFTGHFDKDVDPCITEALLRHPEGGAIAVVAPAREGKPHFHDPKTEFPLMMREGKLDGTTQTMTSFWMAALADGKTTGEALATAKAGLAEDALKSATYHQGLCEINLLGDPSLPVR